MIPRDRDREQELADLIKASISEQVYAASPPSDLVARAVRGARRRRMTQASLAGAASLAAAGLLVPVLLTGQWGLGGGGSHAPLGSQPMVTLTVTQTITTPPTPSPSPSQTPTTTAAPSPTSPTTSSAPPPSWSRIAQARAEALVAMAQDPLPGLVSRVAFAPSVQVRVGQAVVVTVPREELANRDAWVLGDRTTEYAQRGGPFDVLDPLRSTPPADTTWGIGQHAGCSVPELPANLVPNTRRVWIQPKEGTISSCIDWWSVDMWITDDGEVTAVSLELGAP